MTSFLRVYPVSCHLLPRGVIAAAWWYKVDNLWNRHKKEKAVLFLVQLHRAVTSSRFLAFVFSIALSLRYCCVGIPLSLWMKFCLGFGIFAASYCDWARILK